MAYEKEAPKNQGDEGKGKDEDKEILIEARKYLAECVEEESIERAKMADDLKFSTLDQWPSTVRAEREDPNQEGGPRPCLTIDKINQYLVQVVNDVRQGKPGINVRPQDDAADIETAKILKGLIRNIEDQSKADIPYSVAVESAARIGLGYFRITTEYVSEDSFDQELFIRPIPNTFSAYLGKHLMPDGSDAERGYIAESMPIEKFKEMFPKAKYAKDDFDLLPREAVTYWRSEETITVVEEFCFERTREELLFLDDGTTITAADYSKWPKEIEPKPGVQDRRDTFRKQLKWRKITGCEVLEKRDLPGQFIPIVEVVGRESWVDGKRVLWGLVRPAKDSLRMYNYWASTITEKMALAPKTPYIGAKGQFEGMEERWKKANRINSAYLEYNPIDVNGNALPRPERQQATPIEAALLKQMEVIEHDVQTSLGIFKAGIGESESQQSGRAILALQRESDTGTFHFGANLGVSIRHAGRIILDLIPHYYDTKRVVRIMGEDGEVQTATLDPNLPTPYQNTQQGPMFNPGMGKYDISITVGPSYNTKRMEAAATFVELSKGAADPISAAVLRYLTVRNSDFSGSDEAAKMLKALLPPPVLEATQGEQQIPPAAKAQIVQLQQQLQMMQQELQEEQAGTKQAAMKVQADHDAKLKAIELDRQVEDAKARLAKENADRDARLAREKAEAEIGLKRYMCEQENELKDLEAGAEHSREEKRLGMEQEKHAREAEEKRNENAKDEAVEVAPQFMQALEKITQTFAEALAQQQQAQTQAIAVLADAIKNQGPKKIVLGGINRNEAGITGATATIQ